MRIAQIRHLIATVSAMAAIAVAGSGVAHAAPTYKWTVAPGIDAAYVSAAQEDTGNANSFVLGYLLGATHRQSAVADCAYLQEPPQLPGNGEYRYGELAPSECGNTVGRWHTTANSPTCLFVQDNNGAPLMTNTNQLISLLDVCTTPPDDGGMWASVLFDPDSYTEGCNGCVDNAVVLPSCPDYTVYANYDPPSNGLRDPDGTEAAGRGSPGYAGVPEQAVTQPIPGFGTRYRTANTLTDLMKDTSRPNHYTAWGFMTAPCLAGDRVGDPAAPSSSTPQNAPNE